MIRKEVSCSRSGDKWQIGEFGGKLAYFNEISMVQNLAMSSSHRERISCYYS